jgi:cytosine/adenosine deaminase-related metal-dependent hydrolase
LEEIELGMARIQECEAAGARVVLGVQPHAPYSAGLELYIEAARLAQQRGYRLSTHLAETEEEIRFVREGAGPFVDLLRELGKWDGSIRATGLHPVQWLEPALKMGPWLLAHCNYVEDAHIEVLARCGASVVYCPVASDYFGHHRPWRGSVHRYREMLGAGVNVCLGTDSIVCQPADASGGASLGVLEQMRHLYRRDGTDPGTLLRMATVNGMRAMGLTEADATLRSGAAAKLVGIPIDLDDPTEPLEQALRSGAGVSVIEG